LPLSILSFLLYSSGAHRDLHSFPTRRSSDLIGRGKVRDIYAVGNDKMLIVTSDRLSAFDVVLSDPIPDKGRVLNEMASFWFSTRSEEHTSELQSRGHLVCRLLLEKKKTKKGG